MERLDSLPSEVSGRRKRDPDVLTEGQIEVLRILAEAMGPISNRIISQRYKGVGVFDGITGKLLGWLNPEKRARDDAEGPVSLITRGYASFQQLDIDGATEIVYSITSAGRRALANAQN